MGLKRLVPSFIFLTDDGSETLIGRTETGIKVVFLDPPKSQVIIFCRKKTVKIEPVDETIPYSHTCYFVVIVVNPFSVTNTRNGREIYY